MSKNILFGTMALTRDFKETVQKRIDSDPAFASG